MRRCASLLVLLSACASGRGASVDSGADHDGSNPGDAGEIDALIVDATPDAMIVDARPDAMSPADASLPPDACTPTWIELLDNGDFDAGNTVWQSTSDGGSIIRQWGGGYPWQPHSGTWGAVFLGYNNGSQSLIQTLTVPAGTTALRLDGFGCFVTEESTTTNVYDTLVVRVRRGPVVLADRLYTNLDAGATCSWAPLTQLVPAASPGDSLTVELEAGSDVSSITSFGIDSLRFEALACP